MTHLFMCSTLYFWGYNAPCGVWHTAYSRRWLCILLFADDEMFSDTYKIKLVDEVLYEVTGKLIVRKVGDVQLDGANPSAEEGAEDCEEGSESGVDVVLNHRLQETFAFSDKKSYTAYLKDYMKKLVEKLQETAPEQVDVFKTNMNKVMKELLGRFKDLQFFTGM